MHPVIQVEELHRQLGDPDLILLDASWYLPGAGRDPDREFLESRIAGAERFDFDGKVADRSSDLPHMLPTEPAFTEAARSLGINSGSRVVIYDSAGLFAAPRAWWMFEAMGHACVQVLDGGLPAWRAARKPVEAGTVSGTAGRGNFEARLDRARIADAAMVLMQLGNHRETRVLDARALDRFAGHSAEPRPGLRSGHMPGAVNLPYDVLLDGGRLKSVHALRRAFAAREADQVDKVIATCGSGVTAAILALAYEVAYGRPVAVYDGSWAEWAHPARTELPVSSFRCA